MSARAAPTPDRLDRLSSALADDPDGILDAVRPAPAESVGAVRMPTVPDLGFLSPSAAGARQRILDTADRLFYGEGIRSVGIDRIIAESGVSKASFYKHFVSKDTLIAEYLMARHRAEAARMGALEALDPRDAVRGAVDLIIAEIDSAGFRGCPWLNAAAEFPDPHHVVREAVTVHREWYTDAVTALLRAAGVHLPGDAADDLVLARDGAMSGGYAGDMVSSIAALRRVTDRILGDPRR